MSEEGKQAYIKAHFSAPVTLPSDVIKLRARTSYPVTIVEKAIAGMKSDVVTPASGVTTLNETRISGSEIRNVMYALIVSIRTAPAPVRR
jgi:hypothetical protein